jgi:sugar-specific transcriptional regulator TrmB
MKQSLYNIIEEQRYTLSEIEAMSGELTPELEEQLVINAHQLESKSIAYLEVIKDREAYINNAKEEIKRLQNIVKVNDNLVSRLKDNLLTAVKTFGEFEVGFVKFSTRKSTSVNVVEDMINQLPKEYKTIKVTESANKTAIKKALQQGIEIDGCRLIENENLSIK